MINIAVQGCSHGELDVIYQNIANTESLSGTKVDLLLLCGDLQCVRDAFDLQCVAVPQKYRKLNTFHQYVTGEKFAPVMTIFVGGNHEASNILQSLYYGGFVAPNIYFLGFAGVVNYKGLRIAGLSGIFNERHYHLGHFEYPPYTEDSMRSIYHLRELEIIKMQYMSQSRRNVDVFLSHDWPRYIWEHGDKNTLLQIKPYFKDDIDKGQLGSPPLREILERVKPEFWFAAHLHVKFPAVFVHSDDLKASPQNEQPGIKRSSVTKFLALDKVIPGRGFMQFLSIPTYANHTSTYPDSELHFDLEWLTIVRKTNHLLNSRLYQQGFKTIASHFSGIDFPSTEEVAETRQMIEAVYGEKLMIPNLAPQPIICGQVDYGNPQTDQLLNCLNLQHIWTQPSVKRTSTVNQSSVNYRSTSSLYHGQSQNYKSNNRYQTPDFQQTSRSERSQSINESYGHSPYNMTTMYNAPAVHSSNSVLFTKDDNEIDLDEITCDKDEIVDLADEEEIVFKGRNHPQSSSEAILPEKRTFEKAFDENEIDI